MQTRDSHQMEVPVFCIRTFISVGKDSRSPFLIPTSPRAGISLQSPGQRRQIAGAQTAAGIQRGSGDDPSAQRSVLRQRIALAVEAPSLSCPCTGRRRSVISQC